MLETTLVAISNTLSELLRCESWARYNEELLDLIHSLETATRSMMETESVVTSYKLSN
jgi:hypothetical protein